MSDLRHDPINDLWVAMADNRRSRPMEFVPMEQVRQQIICPFCKGNESETPAAIVAYRSDGETIKDSHQETDWTARVIANKYPSFSTPGSPPQPPRWRRGLKSDPAKSNGMPFRVDESQGVQELIIPTPRHLTSISELTDPELELSFRVHRDRLAVLKNSPGMKHGMLFLNCRSGAGASLGHLHWQLIGSPLVSDKLRHRCQQETQFIAEQGGSLLQSLTDWEIEQETRILRLTDRFCVVCPFASQFPFQVAIIPRQAGGSFIDCQNDVLSELAIHCRDVVARLESLLNHPAYNVLLETPTFEYYDQQPWSMVIFPRLTIPAGYEWGTGIWVNPVAPETAARAILGADEDLSAG